MIYHGRHYVLFLANTLPVVTHVLCSPCHSLREGGQRSHPRSYRLGLFNTALSSWLFRARDIMSRARRDQWVTVATTGSARYRLDHPAPPQARSGIFISPRGGRVRCLFLCWSWRRTDFITLGIQSLEVGGGGGGGRGGAYLTTIVVMRGWL